MDVSIVIVSFNTAGFTLRCLKSISEQIKEYEYEVIVVDNASTDGSPLRIAVEFPQVKLIRNDLNIGLAGATTQGLELSAGRYVVAMNDVDWSMRLWKAGWKLWYFPEAPVIHYGGRSANGESPKMFRIRMQSSIKLIQKHYGVLAGLAVREALVFIGIAGYAKWLLLSMWRKARRRDLGPIRRARFGAMLRAAMSLHN
jgi:GT2 family glycosyltransferase